MRGTSSWRSRLGVLAAGAVMSTATTGVVAIAAAAHTPSSSAWRRAIAERHAAEIEAMYENVMAPSRPRDGASGVVTAESRW